MCVYTCIRIYTIYTLIHIQNVLKDNINAKRRQETYNDAVHGNIKKGTRKIIMFTYSIPLGIWVRKFQQ